MIKAPIKWAGGKSWLLPKIQKDFDKFENHAFIEPFCGSAVLSLNIEGASYIVANDINESLINFYKWLSHGETIDVDSFEMTEEEYYRIREEFNKYKEFQSIEQFKRFYYLNRAGFNGLYRENKKGVFNVPWGRREKILPINNEAYNAAKKVQWRRGNYAAKVHAPSFVYIDPPYYDTFTDYSKDGFTLENQKELLRWITSQNVPFVISNNYCDEMMELYKDLNIELIGVPRRISCNGDRRLKFEIYAKNF